MESAYNFSSLLKFFLLLHEDEQPIGGSYHVTRCTDVMVATEENLIMGHNEVVQS